MLRGVKAPPGRVGGPGKEVHETGLKRRTIDERPIRADLEGQNRLSLEGLKCSYDKQSRIMLHNLKQLLDSSELEFFSV